MREWMRILLRFQFEDGNLRIIQKAGDGIGVSETAGYEKRAAAEGELTVGKIGENLVIRTQKPADDGQTDNAAVGVTA